MVNKRKLLILAGLILLIMIINYKSQPQTVAPACFSEEDCIVPVQSGYCDVGYDCIVGKCYSEQFRCPEICYGFKDEDYDNLIDCRDPDCFDSKHCPCEQASFNQCKNFQCYCGTGSSQWFVVEGEHWCQCT